MATLEDVAQRAKVSEGTVSRVLRNDRSNGFSISDATRQRILAAARELNYVPNTAARAVARGRTGLIGVVIPRLSASYFERILAGVQTATMERKYAVVLHAVGLDDFPEEETLEALRSCKIDGCIAAHSALPPVAFQELRNQGISLVLLSTVSVPGQAAVHVNEVVGGRLLGEHLLSLGHRRIAFLGHEGQVFSDLRRQGVSDVLATAGLELVEAPPPPPMPPNIEWWDMGEVLAGQLLSHRPEVTAIVCSDDFMAVGALKAAHASGRRVPEDLAITGYDDMYWTNFTSPTLTTVAQPKEEQGLHAVELLCEVMEGGAPREIWLEPWLKARQSTAPLGSLSSKPYEKTTRRNLDVAQSSKAPGTERRQRRS